MEAILMYSWHDEAIFKLASGHDHRHRSFREGGREGGCQPRGAAAATAAAPIARPFAVRFDQGDLHLHAKPTV